MTWEWDPTLFAGSAGYYARGRLPYPRALVGAIRDELGLDGSQRLLDVGCGPGSLTHLLAQHVADAVGIDADADMIREAEQGAAVNERFQQLRAEELPAGLGIFAVITFAQSFHWLEQRRVASVARAMLDAGGAVVHVGATTHAGDGNVPREKIGNLVRAYLGPHRRAGAGMLPEGTPSGEEEAFAAAGFAGPTRIDVPAGAVFERSEDDVVASVFSMSSAAPHLFGERRDAFEADLRSILRRANSDGRFHERVGDIGVRIWRC